jgi:hypothetical protein
MGNHDPPLKRSNNDGKGWPNGDSRHLHGDPYWGIAT